MIPPPIIYLFRVTNYVTHITSKNLTNRDNWHLPLHCHFYCTLKLAWLASERRRVLGNVVRVKNKPPLALFVGFKKTTYGVYIKTATIKGVGP